jgi:Holliday junction DNA helicase RuvB
MDNRRPEKLQDFIGNEAVKQQVEMVLKSVKKQKDGRFPHVLLYGNAGSGKTTLSRIIANELGNPLITITGNTIKNQVELACLLCDMYDKYQETGKPVIVFIDEIHSLTSSQELDQTIWFPLLEDFIFYNNLEGKTWEHKGQTRRGTNNEAKYPPFTCIGATTDITDLDPALRRRFILHLFMKPYTTDELALIVRNNAQKQGVNITEPASIGIARRSRYTPATALAYFQNCYYYMNANDKKTIDEETVNATMEMLGIDEEGLKWEDRKVLQTLATAEKGMGASNLAGTAGIPIDVLTEICEPFLKNRGLMAVTSRRIITPKGREYIGGNNG